MSGQPPKAPPTASQGLIDDDRALRLSELDLSEIDLTPPTESEWRDFMRNLIYASKIRKIESEESKISAASIAIMATIDLIRDREKSSSFFILEPFWDVLLPLGDKLNPKPKKMERSNLEQIAAIAVQELMDAGQSLEQACRRVGREIIRYPSVQPRNGAPIYKTVEGWRERQREDRGGLDFEERVQKWRDSYQDAAGRSGQPAERAKHLLDLLSSGAKT